MNKSQLGCIAEFEFDIQVIKRGLASLKPMVDVHGYDRVVQGKKLYRVQIKSTHRVLADRKRECYSLNVCTLRRREESGSDFFALYLQPINTWYIIPTKEIENKRSLKIYATGKDKWGLYKEAWSLLSS